MTYPQVGDRIKIIKRGSWPGQRSRLQYGTPLGWEGNVKKIEGFTGIYLDNWFMGIDRWGGELWDYPAFEIIRNELITTDI